MIDAVFAALDEAAASNDASFVAAANHSWKKVGSQDPGSFDFFGHNYEK